MIIIKSKINLLTEFVRNSKIIIDYFVAESFQAFVTLTEHLLFLMRSWLLYYLEINFFIVQVAD